METILAPEAARRLESEAGYRYVDVRSEGEFASGHPEGAVNVPLLHYDPATGPRPNPDFLAVIKAHFAKDAGLLLGCQSGARSAHAGELLERAGYTRVANMDGGFAGRAAPDGTVVAPGWAALGLPVSTQVDDERSYAALARAVHEDC